jgi:hypothetical protein
MRDALEKAQEDGTMLALYSDELNKLDIEESEGGTSILPITDTLTDDLWESIDEGSLE